MATFGFFDIPADNVARAGKFYRSILNGKIEPAKDFPFPEHQRHTIITGKPEEGAISSGGLCKRHGPGPILVFAEVADIDVVLANMENPGGKITLPKGGIEGVGFFAVIADTEGNAIDPPAAAVRRTRKNFPACIPAFGRSSRSVTSQTRTAKLTPARRQTRGRPRRTKSGNACTIF